MTDPAVEAARRAREYTEGRSRHVQRVAAAREALKQVRDDLQVVDSILGLLHHRGLVDTDQNRADVAAAFEIVKGYTRDR